MAVSAAGSIDVATIVSQLMTVERRPLDALQKRESDIQSRLTAFGRVQSAVSTLDSAFSDLRSVTTWNATAASVNGEAVTAAVSGTAATGRYSVSVMQLARVQSLASGVITDAAVGTGTLTIELGSYDTGANAFTPKAGSAPISITIDAAHASLAGIRDAINAAGAGVNASIVSDSAGPRLVLTSRDTGGVNGFRLTVGDDDGNNTDASGLSRLAFDPTAAAGSGRNLALTQTAQDASYAINGLALNSTSNVVADAIVGITLNLVKSPPAGSAPGSTVDAEVVVAQDKDRAKAAASAFVKAYNDLALLVDELTKYDPNTRTAAVLNGEGVLRRLTTQLRSLATGAMSAPSGDYTRLDQVGIAFGTGGKLTFDETAFLGAIAADAGKVKRLFSSTSAVDAEQGFAVRLHAIVSAALDQQGMLGARQESLRASIGTLDRQQEQMQARLDQKQKLLIAQYSRLDALVSQRQTQLDSLVSALAGLPRTSV